MALRRPKGGTAEPSTPSVAWTPTQVAVAVRALILVLIFCVSLLADNRTEALTWYPLLVGVAVAASARQWTGPIGRVARLLETVAAVVAVLQTGAAESPLFPYLLAPTFTAGLLAGVVGVLEVSAVALTALLAAAPIANHTTSSYVAASAQWVVLAVAAGLAAAWIRRLLTPSQRAPELVDTSYAAAYRLLAQLRPVARQLSVGLDPLTIAEGLLQSLRALYGFERGAVLVRTGSDRLVPLAVLGTERVDWDVTVTGDGPFAEAWLGQRRQRIARQLSGPDGSAAVIPLVIGLRTFGLVGIETGQERMFRSVSPEEARVVEEAALRLETAMLFDEVRGVATAEERRRLAREIHDGIAQELSYLGYVVDALAADARSMEPGFVEQLESLRKEITRIISELRLSIYDLRSEVDAHGGLGAALSEYVRSVGRQSGLKVHLSLAEAPNRLPAETEAELLRIAQEAITNCRKHAAAENLWVSLEVEPPGATLRIEDDGKGLGSARTDSYGLQIMRERAQRLRTSVQVRPREPCGTLVEVSLPTAGDRASLDPAAEKELR